MGCEEFLDAVADSFEEMLHVAEDAMRTGQPIPGVEGLRGNERFLTLSRMARDYREAMVLARSPLLRRRSPSYPGYTCEGRTIEAGGTSTCADGQEVFWSALHRASDEDYGARMRAVSANNMSKWQRECQKRQAEAERLAAEQEEREALVGGPTEAEVPIREEFLPPEFKGRKRLASMEELEKRFKRLDETIATAGTRPAAPARGVNPFWSESPTYTEIESGWQCLVDLACMQARGWEYDEDDRALRKMSGSRPVIIILDERSKVHAVLVDDLYKTSAGTLPSDVRDDISGCYRGMR